MNPALKRDPCAGCGRSRLACWSDPCSELMELVRVSLHHPEASSQVRQWCAEGGFDLYRDHPRNWPLARPRFAVGDGANYAFNGDAYPVTVIEVSQGESRVVVQRDRAIRKTLFIIDPKGKTMVFTRRRDGVYRSSKCGTWTLDLGRRKEWNNEL